MIDPEVFGPFEAPRASRSPQTLPPLGALKGPYRRGWGLLGRWERDTSPGLGYALLGCPEPVTTQDDLWARLSCFLQISQRLLPQNPEPWQRGGPGWPRFPVS